MQERRKDKSFFDFYMNILPKDIKEFPVFFTEEEKSWLDGSRFQNMINEKIEDVKKDYDLVCGEVPDF